MVKLYIKITLKAKANKARSMLDQVNKNLSKLA